MKISPREGRKRPAGPLTRRHAPSKEALLGSGQPLFKRVDVQAQQAYELLLYLHVKIPGQADRFGEIDFMIKSFYVLAMAKSRLQISLCNCYAFPLAAYTLAQAKESPT